MKSTMLAKNTDTAPKVSVASVSASIHRKVDQLLLEDDLAVFRVTYQVDFQEPVPANLAAWYQSHTFEGFARPQDLEKFLADKAKNIETIQGLTLVPAGFREHARLHGYVAACDKFKTYRTDNCGAYELFASGAASLEDLVVLEHGGHMLFDRNGEVLPTALFFNYMNGNVHNGCYLLKKTLGILRKDPRITPIRERRSGEAEAVDKDGWHPQNVPHYNASGACSWHVAFSFAPTADDMKRLWAQMKSYNTKYPSTLAHQAVFDLDMLGLRAGGAAKYSAYHMADASDD